MTEVKKMGIGEGGRTLKEVLEETERSTEEAGHFTGITELRLKEQDPIRYELFHSRILSSLIAGRETTRMIAASPVTREVGELCIGLYTPDGYGIANSTGIMVHTAPMGEAIRWMIRNDYEEDPGINEGDLFCCNDCSIAGMHPADVYDIMPIFWEGEVVAWVVTVIMEADIGAVSSGPMPSIHNVERFTDGFFVCAEKTGTNDTLRRDFQIRAERTLRRPAMFILDRKGALAADIKVREDVRQLIQEFGLDYFKRATRELIEDSRRIQLYRMRQRTVPGRLRMPMWLELYFKDLPVPAYARRDVIRLIPTDVEVKPSGQIAVDFEGAGAWGYHSMNCTPSAIYGGLSITMTETMAYDGKANHGTLMTLDVNCPYDSIMNPPTIYIPTACIWAPALTFVGNLIDGLSRAYFARGFREEILLGLNSASYVGDSRLAPGDPRIQMMGEFSLFGGVFFIGAQGSGGRGIADGIEHHMWQPEPDTGSAEIMELVASAVAIGRRVIPDSGGFGKYRGGFCLDTTIMLHRADWGILESLGLNATRHMLENRGVFGGYPGNLHYGYVVRNANTRELIEQRLPIPHTEGDPRNPDVKKLMKGDITLMKQWYCSDEVLRDYDLVQVLHNANNGGYGDPIDRGLELIKSDLDLGFTTEEACRNIYCAQVNYSKKEEDWTIDEQKTRELREMRRKERLQKGIPFQVWWQKTRDQIMEGELDPLLLEMYRNSMEKGPRFAEEFRQFWSLPQDFTFGGE